MVSIIIVAFICATIVGIVLICTKQGCCHPRTSRREIDLKPLIKDKTITQWDVAKIIIEGEHIRLEYYNKDINDCY